MRRGSRWGNMLLGVVGGDDERNEFARSSPAKISFPLFLLHKSNTFLFQGSINQNQNAAQTSFGLSNVRGRFEASSNAAISCDWSSTTSYRWISREWYVLRLVAAEKYLGCAVLIVIALNRE